MRAVALSLVLALFAALPAAAQDDPVSSVIQRQFEAFLRDDFEAAFTFASPAIKRLFQTPENFEAMVRRGYPMVHRPAEIDYLDQRPVDGVTYQTVEIIDGSGRAHYLEYEMVESSLGWQINGVRFVRAPAVGV